MALELFQRIEKLTDRAVKVVLSFDLGENFIRELREEFTQVDFKIGMTPEDQAREAIFHDNATSLVAEFRRGVQAVVKP
jgi:hypothetical protein